MDDRASTGAAQPGSGAEEDRTGQVDAAGIDSDSDGSSTTDRPYVDGAAASPAELRAEVRRLSDEDRQHVDDLRDELGDSVAELAARFDVKARVAEKRDDAVATLQQRAGRARAAAVEGAVTAKDTARERPAWVAGLVAALLVLLVLVLRRRRG